MVELIFLLFSPVFQTYYNISSFSLPDIIFLSSFLSLSSSRFKTLNEAIGYADKDGLNSLQYEVTDTVKHPCYTKISVDLHKEKDKQIKSR